VIPLVPLQLSLALTPPNTSGTAARQLVPALALVGAGQITVGAVASVTVKVVVQVAPVGRRIARRHRDHVHAQSTSVPACRTLLKVMPWFRCKCRLRSRRSTHPHRRQAVVSALALVAPANHRRAVASVTGEGRRAGALLSPHPSPSP